MHNRKWISPSNIALEIGIAGLEEVQRLQMFWPLHRLTLNKFRKIFCY